MGQAHYLTIRCPYGCEAWLQPSSFGRHRDRCRRRQWVDDLDDTAVIPVSFVGVLAGILPEGFVDDVNPEVRRSRRNEVGFDFRYGRGMRSPVEGVTARRWLHVAMRGLDLKGVQAVRQALTLDAFVALEDDVVAAGESARCSSCGEYVTRRGMGKHQATNIVCRWRRAVAEVEEAWDAGWRDPHNVDGAPLTWAELRSRVRWTKRMLTVAYPRWTAVLLRSADGFDDSFRHGADAAGSAPVCRNNGAQHAGRGNDGARHGV
ncbi:MAG: hypothetical protein M3P34_10880 [Actinomycetota bacterium]|nr:hypothetical protein [Actinomycetota bacterium]